MGLPCLSFPAWPSLLGFPWLSLAFPGLPWLSGLAFPAEAFDDALFLLCCYCKILTNCLLPTSQGLQQRATYTRLMASHLMRSRALACARTNSQTIHARSSVSGDEQA